MKRRLIQRPLLLPFCLIYRIIVFVRNLLFDIGILSSTRFDIPVISVGNITVGGTGKTPHVEYLVQLLQKHFRVAVLSRGYKRDSKGFVLASGKSTLADIGDECLQIKQKFPGIQVAVDKNRVHGAVKLLNEIPQTDVIVLDDAFQHRYIVPGLSILLVDFTRPIFEDVLLPAGNLREPWRNSRRADMIIITKCPPYLTRTEKKHFVSKLRLRKKQKVLFSSYSYGALEFVFPGKHNTDKKVRYKHLRKSDAGIFLVTGIANPQPLLQYLNHILQVNESLFFPDHHPFSPDDLQTIIRQFRSMPFEEKYIIVTEKDAVRLRELEITDKAVRKAFLFMPVEVAFFDKKAFDASILKYLKKASG